MRTPLFYLSALLLACNDFVWKAQFHNAFTGKLSDFAGIALWVLFWEAWLPQRFRAHLYCLSAMVFMWFKSPLSEGALQFLHLQRVVDYTDLYALLVLLPLYFLNKKMNFVTWQPTVLASIIALFLFGATSFDKGNELENFFYCEPDTFKINRSDDSVKQRIRTLFPTENEIVESRTKDTSYIKIGFKSSPCTKGISIVFNMYAINSDSCAIKVRSINTVCRGETVDNSALCRAVQESIFQKLR